MASSLARMSMRRCSSRLRTLGLALRMPDISVLAPVAGSSLIVLQGRFPRLQVASNEMRLSRSHRGVLAVVLDPIGRAVSIEAHGAGEDGELSLDALANEIDLIDSSPEVLSHISGDVVE